MTILLYKTSVCMYLGNQKQKCKNKENLTSSTDQIVVMFTTKCSSIMVNVLVHFAQKLDPSHFQDAYRFIQKKKKGLLVLNLSANLHTVVKVVICEAYMFLV